MSQIVPLIMNAMLVALTAEMQTAIPVDDPTRADIVKIGMFQDDPKKDNVHIFISGGDQENPGYRDGIVTLEEMDNIGFRMPPREVGGGQFWWRRGVVNVGAYFIREKLAETVATEKAYEVLGRIEATIEQVRITALVDSFGERGFRIFCYGNTYFEAGGPPNKYLFRGKVLWAALTTRP